MSKQQKKSGAARPLSATSRRMDFRLRLLLQTGPLLHGESREAYRDLLNRTRDALSPRDFIDEVLVKDVADLSWEILRIRRLKADLLFSPIAQKKFDVLKLLGLEERKILELLNLSAAGNFQATEEISDYLSIAGKPAASIEAEVLVERAHGLSQLDDMIATYEKRRDALLRQLELRQDSPARRLKNEIVDIEDGEYQVTDNVQQLPN